MKPSIARIVHVVYTRAEEDHSDLCNAGLVVAVGDGTPGRGALGDIDCWVFGNGWMSFVSDVAYSEDHVNGTWHWPERVE